MTGKILAHYEILEKLGEGGMGVVYKARDTHLDRFVAIKVLPHDAVADPERKRRFIQEARAASALNHPNIVIVHDIAQQGDVDYMVMEYIDGKSLGQLIGRKGMPLGDALTVASQVADALGRAHAAGIVHRDIKPGNVMVGKNGTAKLLDFGLAKLIATQPAIPTSADAPTEVRVRTEQGMILGTPDYMSPEQAQGKDADSRSDIFSFGAMLYEMASGQKPFHREDRLSSLTAVLRDDPAPIDGVPGDFQRIIRQCLHKQPRRRFQHMDDVRVELENLRDESESGRFAALPSIAGPRPRYPRIAAFAVPMLVLLGVATWAALRSRQPAPAVPAMQMRRLTADSGLTTEPALSPDGKWVAFASDASGEGSLDIWVQQIATGERRRLTSSSADEHEPAFSPDSSLVAFRSEQDGGGIYVISLLGGEAKRIARRGRNPRYSPDGTRIAYWEGEIGPNSSYNGTIWVIPVNGGTPVQVRPEWTHAAHPQWSPDGKLLVANVDALAGALYRRQLWVTSLDRPQAPPVPMSPEVAGPQLGPVGAWVNGGEPQSTEVYFHRLNPGSADLWRARVTALGTFSGEAERLTFGTNPLILPSVARTNQGALIAFASLRENRDVWSLPIDANKAAAIGPLNRITDQESNETRPTVTEDGSRIAYTSNRLPFGAFILRDLKSGKETFLAQGKEGSGAGNGGAMSRNGRHFAYLMAGKAYYVGEAGEPTVVCQDCPVITSISRDGSLLLIQGAATSIPIQVIETATKRRTAILQDDRLYLSVARFSPDARWVSFTSIPAPNERQIYVAPYRGPRRIDKKEWIPITDGKGMERYADWSPDGNTLYFLSERDGYRCIRAQRLNPATKQPAGPPIDIQHFHNARRSLLAIGDPISVGLAVAADKLVFGMVETTGNLWMLKLP